MIISRYLDGKKVYRIIFIALCLSFTLIFLFAAFRLSSTNSNPEQAFSDQLAYMAHVRQIHSESDHIYLGDRNRMPLYNYIQAFFYNPEMSEQEQFVVGKTVNIFLSLFSLFVLFVFLGRYYLDKEHSLLLTLIGGLVLILQYAPLYAVEALFYLSFLITFIIMCWSLKKKTMLSSIFVGISAAISYYLKGSVLPLLIIYLASALAQALVAKNKTIIIDAVKRSGISLLVFLTLLSPYLVSNLYKFGDPFYNVNTKFYIWYDSWEDVTNGTRAHGDRTGWPDLPDEDIPSLRKYVSEPGWEVKGFNRMKDGVDYLVSDNFRLGFDDYTSNAFTIVVVFAGYISALALIRRRRVMSWAKENWTLVAFVITSLTSLFLLFAWYVPIAIGPRFLLTLFLPILFTEVYILYKFRVDKIYLLANRQIEVRYVTGLISTLLLLGTLSQIIDIL